jgi:single-stranded DNA-binding protein
VNVVSLIGTLASEPELRKNRAGIDECRMRLAVPRRSRDGRPAPGVVYVDVTTFGQEACECAERLSAGSRIGLSGRLAVDAERSDEDGWEESHGVLIDQLDFLG